MTTDVAVGAGTTVLQVARVGGRLWLATEAGVLERAAGGWARRPGPPWEALTAAVLDAGGALLAWGMPAGLAYSPDGGGRWYDSWADEVGAAVTCAAASPRVAEDRVLLAGTAGDGVLRSTDGGRRWRLANFGLEGFSVVALAVAPSWGRREEAFAATEEGVYRSPNGGRAWVRADSGIEGAAVQALAVSPGFAEERTVFAGAEGGPMLRSRDGARSWEALPASPHDVNAILADPALPGRLVVGTAGGQLALSDDGGETWRLTLDEADAVLSLLADGGEVYAGRYGGGLLVSPDGGESWRQDLGG